MTDTSPQTPELLPCPFCGAVDGVYSEQMGPAHAVARCSNCNATHCCNTEAEAIVRWNTRDQSALTRARLEAAEDMKAAQPVIAIVTYSDGGEDVETYDLNGYYQSSACEHKADLIPATAKARLWVNVDAEGRVAAFARADVAERPGRPAHLGTFPCIIPNIPADVAEAAGLEIVTEEEGKS